MRLNNGKFICLLFLFLTNSVFLHSQPVQKTIKRLPDTGQTKSYTNTFGEDNDYYINKPFYINNTNGTITDTVSGLMWQQTDGGEMTFENAQLYVDSLKVGGHDDWRLPSAFEAFSIQNHQNNNPALDINFFTKNTAEYWWTNDHQKNDVNKIWVTNSGGGVGNHQKTETISAGGTKRYHSRAVRNVNPVISLPVRFEPQGEEVVLDHLTGLFWEKKPNPNSMSWENALTTAEELNLSGFSDWRLPNIKELQSLHEVTFIQPCINTSFFPYMGIKKYWSSTSLSNQVTKAWYLETNFGITSYDTKTNNNYIICIRGGIGGVTSPVLDMKQVETKVNIFPNPASDFINVKVDNSLKHILILRLLDMAGKTVSESSLIAGNDTAIIDIQCLDVGMYFLTTSNGQISNTYTVFIHR